MKPAIILAAGVAAVLALAPSPARAHCDTVDGPVVKDARAAFEARDVTPVLKWVRLFLSGLCRRKRQLSGPVPSTRWEAISVYWTYRTLLQV